MKEKRFKATEITRIDELSIKQELSNSGFDLAKPIIRSDDYTTNEIVFRQDDMEGIKTNIKLGVMREMLEVQGTDGTWNYSPYMMGLYNGMEYMLALAEEREPVFRDVPEVFICDIEMTYGAPKFEVIKGGKN